MEQENVVDGVSPAKRRFVIEAIQRKADGSFIIKCNGFPFHATAVETPDVFQQVEEMIAEGEPWKDLVETKPSLDLELIERAWRDGEIDRLRWLRERHADELALNLDTTLTSGQFTELLGYLQALRDWPESEAFPDQAERPSVPSWLES